MASSSVRKRHAAIKWSKEKVVLVSENTLDRADVPQTSYLLRSAHMFSFWDAEGQPVACGPVAARDSKFLNTLELRAYVSSLNGPARFLAQAGELQVYWPLQHCELMKITKIKSIKIDKSPFFRGNKRCLTVYTKRYIYFLVQPDEWYDAKWDGCIAEWESSEGRRVNLRIVDVDFKKARPEWWYGLLSWLAFKAWARKQLQIAGNGADEEEGQDEDQDYEIAGSDEDTSGDVERPTDQPDEEEESTEEETTHRKVLRGKGALGAIKPPQQHQPRDDRGDSSPERRSTRKSSVKKGKAKAVSSGDESCGGISSSSPERRKKGLKRKTRSDHASSSKKSRPMPEDEFEAATPPFIDYPSPSPAPAQPSESQLVATTTSSTSAGPTTATVPTTSAAPAPSHIPPQPPAVTHQSTPQSTPSRPPATALSFATPSVSNPSGQPSELHSLAPPFASSLPAAPVAPTDPSAFEFAPGADGTFCQASSINLDIPLDTETTQVQLATQVLRNAPPWTFSETTSSSGASDMMSTGTGDSVFHMPTVEPYQEGFGQANPAELAAIVDLMTNLNGDYDPYAPHDLGYPTR